MMKDRFKVRAWDSFRKKMIYGPSDGQESSSWILAVAETDCKTFHPLQCTGRKDKTGKLIYEDDIVEDYYDKYLIKYGEYTHLSSGSSDTIGFYLEPLNQIGKNISDDGVPYDRWGVTNIDFEVAKIIGNKYEKLELKNKLEI